MSKSLTTLLRRPLSSALIGMTALLALPEQAAALTWNWQYSGSGILAAGTFTTADTPDFAGFYQITAITGTRNGEAITGLQTTGTPIPGNEPFNVDNLISLGSTQLTGDGFGYSTASGNYASPFYASFLAVPGYLEVLSAAPFVPGSNNFGPEDSELPISFSATLVTSVPEPIGLGLLATGLGLLTYARRRHPA